ncbi:MAG: hypothetical protein A2Z91_06675 [Deltaproteobacteria bacterium GWA2_38_16]|nr:MAG: hypothetical protein A2Z91_06675 [Deltaproteobacteria bacterium GWA2_38_16]OGQ03406.1 MAG: hypothetical protein A3D19_04735 [Deltaproteobacteria bacterium RIFCSPHIGHO2_02_FULL_38_15]OGQ34711.1 MAG: hypothetical protein A3A72_07395 [Deltaproteobacteria bacterium RIFCSPLOWO2_01_FULL_38_9]HBQ20684.1 adenylate cyclase [Deltaproteobacteria bacterium]
MPNIEIKARHQNLLRAREIAIKLNAKREGIDLQTDTYFKTQGGRLKLRESSLKGARLIPYVRTDQIGPKLSQYLLVPIEQPQIFKNLLKEILGIEVIVKKEREIYLIGNVRVHLDSVENLGSFIEFEAVFDDVSEEIYKVEVEKVNKLIQDFKIKETDLIKGSYRELRQVT